MNSSHPTSAPCQSALQIGSVGLHVSAPQACYIKDLSLLYTAELQDRSSVPAPTLYVHIEHGRNTSDVEIPADGLVLTPDGGMHTEAMSGYFDISSSTLRLVVYNQALPNHERQIYLIVLLNKVLFGMGMIRMHASAIQLHGRVAAFTGDRGAGKSSITTRLAMAGGLVLADDDIMLRKQDKQFWASGCDETMRILPDAEAYFYQHLSEPTQTFAGIDKKEIRTADRYRSEAYLDYPLDHLFFSRVGNSFSITPLPAREVVLRLMASLVPSNRYAGFSDQATTLDYLMTLATSMPCYDLELSPNLQELDRLVDFLEEGVG